MFHMLWRFHYSNGKNGLRVCNISDNQQNKTRYLLTISRNTQILMLFLNELTKITII